MRLLTDASALDRYLSENGPRSCVVVPTMGGLHAGHAALIEHAARLAQDEGLAGGALVTVFVNPTQFDQKSDFDRYPRTIEADMDLCARAGASAVLAPSVEQVYPRSQPPPTPELPPQARARGLEDAHRPGHFEGVCQVVARLFEMTSPAAAVFGEKDWQQLQVVREMTQRDRLGVRIVASPTVREPDGLAMSSRNRFLSSEDRARAAQISRGLALAQHAPTPAAAEHTLRQHLESQGLGVDYAVVRHAQTLLPIDPAQSDAPARAIVTARLGTVRLLDNAPWPAPA